LVGGAAGVGALLGASDIAAAQVTTSLTVNGWVTSQQTFNLSGLMALPQTTENVTFLSGTTPTNSTFTGPTLWYLLNNAVGLKTNSAVKNDVLGEVVVVSGSDNYSVVYSLGEFDPMFGGTGANPDLLADANNPGQLLGSDGFARSTAPLDLKGGRYVSNVDNLQVLHVPTLTGTYSGGLSSSFTVTGNVAAPATFNLASLEALPTTTVNVGGGTTYSGVQVWTLLNNVGVTTNPNIKNDILRDYVIFTGSDGYQVALSLGEVDPDFGGSTSNPDIIAYIQNGGAPGTSLGSNGFARLITPQDNAHGRWVSNLINVEVFDTSNWMVFSGQQIDLGNFNYQTLGFQLDGGTLTSTGGPGLLTAPTYTLNGGTITATAMLGPTGVVTQASGLTMLSGLITTPSVAVTGGTLQLEGSNLLASNTTLTLTSGNLDLNGNAQTIATLTGGGNVLLSSNSSGGALTVGSGSFSGIIANNGSRPGSLTVSGPGSLTLSGMNTYTGPTTVSGGTLVVNGSIGSSAVTVNTGGVLAGTGTVGSTTVAGGTLAPGDAVGTMTIKGNLSLNSASTYLIGVTPGAADQAAASGTASLAGAAQAVFQAGNYLPKSYVILSAGNVSGTFGSFSTTGLPFGLAAGLSYTATAVYLSLSSVLGQTAGLNGNQQQVASGIDRGFNAAAGGISGPLAGLYGSSSSVLPSALSQLSGEVATGAPTTAFRATDQFLGLMLDPLVNPSLANSPSGSRAVAAAREQTAALPGAATASDEQVAQAASGGPMYFRNWTVWGAGLGTTGSVDGSASVGSHNLSASNEGGGAGIDFWLQPNVVLGIAAAGGTMDWSVSGLGSGHGDIAQGGVYGATWFGNGYFSSAFLYGHDNLTTNRGVVAGGTTDSLTASYGADHFAGRAEGGERFTLSPTIGATPYAAIEVQSFDADAYSEHDLNGLLAYGLNYAAHTTTDTRSELGARFDSVPLPVAGLGDDAALVLRGRAAWAHDFSPDRTAVASFEALPASGFTVTGAPEAQDAALLSAGLELRLTPTVALTAKFDTLQSGNAHAYAGTAALRVTW
jgi:autotransporter-associated beta strand protein